MYIYIYTNIYIYIVKHISEHIARYIFFTSIYITDMSVHPKGCVCI